METELADPDDLASLREAFEPSVCAPPLGWAAVRAFEAEQRVRLPEPYRTFVAEIADGCTAGPPQYGLIAAAELPADWADDGADAAARDLAAPFPLTEIWQWAEDPRPEDATGPQLAPVFDHGTVVLGTDGYSMCWHLVVTGAHRGHIWWVTGEGAAPFGAPFGHTTAEPGFAGWVRHWAAGKPWFDIGETKIG